MKIVLYGVETINKGAELMLYAILQEIERVHPNAVIYMPESRLPQGIDYVKTSLRIKFWPLEGMIFKLRLLGIFRRLNLPSSWLVNPFVFKGTDYFFDGSGFRFSDQFAAIGERFGWWKRLLKILRKNGAKIVFLPQAFGPIELSNTIKTIKSLSDYSSLIIARENKSYKYLKDSGIVNMNKVRIYPDFTSLVEGVFPVKYEHLKNGVCIIPNIRMIDTNTISLERYIQFLMNIICLIQSSGYVVYILNHEGVEDERLAYKCRECINGNFEVVTGLNALEVKGLLSSAYAVISSRFHGVVSSLNCGVPCLATSWSHKYEELFKDYGLYDNILPLNNDKMAQEKVAFVLDKENNKKMRQQLKVEAERHKEQSKRMWEEIWRT